jgi:PAS domain S-box-containing protein
MLEKYIEPTLTLLENAYEALMDGVPDAVFMLDDHECVARLNPSARLLLCLHEMEIVNRPFKELFPEFPPLSDLCKREKPDRLELIRAGWPKYYDVHILYLKEINEVSHHGCFIVLHDVTALEMAEDKFCKWAHFNIELDNLGKMIKSGNHLQFGLHSLAIQLSEIISADGAAILFLDEDLQAFHVSAAHGILNSLGNQSWECISPILSAVMSQMDIFVIEDIADLNIIDKETAAQFPAQASVNFPLRTGDTPLGIIIVAFSIPHPFTREELSCFEQAVRQARFSIVQACFLGKYETVMYENTLGLEKTNQRLIREITERTNSEKRLQEEHAFISGIVDTLDALVIVIDRKGNIVRVNRACELFFGYTSDELTQKRVWSLLLQSQDNVTIKDMFDNIQAGLSPFQYANHWKTKDGVHKMMAWSSSMLRDTNGNIQYIVAIGMDITERKHIEKLLERERLLFRGLIDSIPDLIFYKDVNGVYGGWNKAFAAFRKLQVMKKDMTDVDLYPLEKAKQFMETDYQVINTGNAMTYENWTSNADGQQLLIETRKTPYYGSDGEILGVIGIGRDITRHRNAENALRAANLEIEQLIASLSSFLIVVSRDLFVVRWNARAQDIFGFSSEKVIGKHLTALEIAWEWEAIAVGIQQCEQEFKPIYLNPLRFRRLNTSEGYLGMNISPIFGSEHTLSGYVLLGSDITERLTMERQLTQAQKLESIGQLAAGIAHEINTPMQYIGDNTSFLQQSFTQLIAALSEYQEILAAAEADSLQPDLIRRVKEVIQGVDVDYLISEVPLAITQTLEGIQRVVEIVSAMKGFSHPGVKKKTPVNINKALLDTLTVARNVWKYVATAETDLDPDLPDVVCLPGEMNQVYLNIIVNAADAISDIMGDGSQGKGKITIQTRKEKDWVEIRISDTGTGIPEEIRNRIFEPFFTTKKVGKGSGQGLAIAYDIVEIKHGGSLTFETRMGEGTTFFIRLPRTPTVKLATKSLSNGTELLKPKE